jgi:hypothetical protein
MKDLRVTMMLCDSAQVAEGKLYILGAGWTITGPAPGPFGIAILIEVPWDLANRKQQWMLRLEDQDGKPVEVERIAVELGGEFEVARPLGLQPGVPLLCPQAINFGPLPLPPGGRYVWRMFINGGSKADWTLSFSTRAGEVKGTAA